MKACALAVLVKHPVVETPIVMPVENEIGVGHAKEAVVVPDGNAKHLVGVTAPSPGADVALYTITHQAAPESVESALTWKL